MKSKLEIIPIGRLQSRVVSTVRSLKGTGIYVSLNKDQKKIKTILKKSKIKTKDLFFIDCVGSEKAEEDVIQISPAKLDDLSGAINSFMREIEGQKFLIVDALSVLLIYNSQDQVAAFVRKMISYATNNDAEVVAFSAKTEGKELLNKIFSSFDEVKGK